jgi:HAD superfamily hydrolase (TIGR01459 family)
LDVELASAADADAILAQGTQVLKGAGGKVDRTNLFANGAVVGGDPLHEALQVCHERGITMLCANPDFQATQPDGSIGYMPGTVARYYEAIGGSVTQFGKPYAAAFDACLERLEGIPRDRICHVGDSLDHDIEGAHAAGIHSLFVTSGIHGPDLPDEGGEGALRDAVAAMCVEKGANQPTYIIRDFKW